MKTTDIHVTLPLRNWILARMTQKIIDFINELTEKETYTPEKVTEGKRNATFLSDIYLNDYHIVYTLRTHPSLFNTLHALQTRTDTENGSVYNNKSLYWRDVYFAGALIDKLLSGEVEFSGIAFTGKLNAELVKPLLTVVPPLQQDINTLLHNNMLLALEKGIADLETDMPEEIFLSSTHELNTLINEKRKEYLALYNKRNDIKEAEFLLILLSDYDLWYTQRGLIASTNILLKKIKIEIKSIIDGALKIMSPQYEKVEKSELDIAKNQYNNMIKSIRFYWSQLDFTTITDHFINEKLKEIGALEINGTPELTAEQMTVSGLMVVKSEYKFLKSFTMREIAFGLPQRESTLFNSLSFDYDGIQKKPHSNLFETMIRQLPDQVEKFLHENSEKILRDPEFTSNLHDFYKNAFRLVLEDFMIKFSDNVREHFSVSINSFLSGATQPTLISINRYQLSEIICLSSSMKASPSADMDNDFLLFASTLTGECKVIHRSISAVRDNPSFQRWLLQHLDVADRFNTDVMDEFLEYRNIVIGQQILRMPNKYPLVFTETDNYLADLCTRRARKIHADADALIKTSSDKARDYIVDFVALSVSVLTLLPVRTLLGFLSQFIAGAVAMTVAETIRFYHADNQERSNISFWNVMRDLIVGLVLNAPAVIRMLKKRITLQITAEKIAHPQIMNTRLPFFKKNPPLTFQDYRYSKNIIAENANSRVYKFGADFLIKDYQRELEDALFQPSSLSLNSPRSGKRPMYNNSLIEANNAAIAFNRLYGKGSARVLIFDGQTHYAKSVSLKMKKLPGKSIASLLREKDEKILGKLKNLLIQSRVESLADEILKGLKINGIAHHDINLGNILYDAKTGAFSLVDFDSAVINPVKNSSIDPLSNDKYGLMRSKLIGDLKECAYLCNNMGKG